MSKKRNSDYKLSPDSQKTSREFGYAARAASRLKNALLPMVFGKHGNALHKRLLSRIVAVLNSGPETKKGERNLGDGDVALLRELQFNPYTPFSRLAHSVSIAVDVSPSSGEVNIRLRDTGSDAFKWPERAVEAFLEIRCMVMGAEQLSVATHALEPLSFRLHDRKTSARNASIPIGNMDDCLILVAGGISFLRTGETEALVSHHRNCYAACILSAICVRDGRVIEFAYGDRSKRVPEISAGPITTWKWD